MCSFIWLLNKTGKAHSENPVLYCIVRWNEIKVTSEKDKEKKSSHNRNLYKFHLFFKQVSNEFPSLLATVLLQGHVQVNWRFLHQLLQHDFFYVGLTDWTSAQMICHTLCNCMAFHLYELSYADKVGWPSQRICHTMCKCMAFPLYEL
jgi:hypothetical protein